MATTMECIDNNSSSITEAPNPEAAGMGDFLTIDVFIASWLLFKLVLTLRALFNRTSEPPETDADRPGSRQQRQAESCSYATHPSQQRAARPSSTPTKSEPAKAFQSTYVSSPLKAAAAQRPSEPAPRVQAPVPAKAAPPPALAAPLERTGSAAQAEPREQAQQHSDQQLRVVNLSRVGSAALAQLAPPAPALRTASSTRTSLDVSTSWKALPSMIHSPIRDPRAAGKGFIPTRHRCQSEGGLLLPPAPAAAIGRGGWTAPAPLQVPDSQDGLLQLGPAFRLRHSDGGATPTAATRGAASGSGGDGLMLPEIYVSPMRKADVVGGFASISEPGGMMTVPEPAAATAGAAQAEAGEGCSSGCGAGGLTDLAALAGMRQGSFSSDVNCGDSGGAVKPKRPPLARKYFDSFHHAPPEVMAVNSPRELAGHPHATRFPPGGAAYSTSNSSSLRPEPVASSPTRSAGSASAPRPAGKVVDLLSPSRPDPIHQLAAEQRHLADQEVFHMAYNPFVLSAPRISFPGIRRRSASTAGDKDRLLPVTSQATGSDGGAASALAGGSGGGGGGGGGAASAAAPAAPANVQSVDTSRANDTSSPTAQGFKALEV